MKIGLVSSLMKDNDIEYQLKQMELYLSSEHLCIFNNKIESYYQWDI